MHSQPLPVPAHLSGSDAVYRIVVLDDAASDRPIPRPSRVAIDVSHRAAQSGPVTVYATFEGVVNKKLAPILVRASVCALGANGSPDPNGPILRQGHISRLYVELDGATCLREREAKSLGLPAVYFDRLDDGARADDRHNVSFTRGQLVWKDGAVPYLGRLPGSR